MDEGDTRDLSRPAAIGFACSRFAPIIRVSPANGNCESCLRELVFMWAAEDALVFGHVYENTSAHKHTSEERATLSIKRGA